MTTHRSIGDLLEKVEGLLNRYVVLPDEETAAALSLFVLHTHAFEAAHATPYIAITSPVKRAGKTRVLEMLELLVANPLRVSNTTPAALFRVIDSGRPTLLLDEVDTVFTASGDANDTLRAILNAGNRPGAHVLRCIGDAHQPTTFNTYSAKVLAGIDTGAWPDTIMDRSIPVRMRRTDQAVPRLRHRDLADKPAEFRAQLSEWTQANLEDLAAARPHFPKGLSDRIEDAWEPLLAIADLAGREWPERAREAAVFLYAKNRPAEDSPGILLLASAREAMNGRDRITTHDLLVHINRDETLPFREWNRGREMTPRQLADFLARFDVRPKTIRQDSRTFKGYLRNDFEQAWTDYLPRGDPPSV